jgi:hypothetical protein
MLLAVDADHRLQEGNSMNFDEALVAHSNWKRRPRSYIAKPDQSLKVGEVGANRRK